MKRRTTQKDVARHAGVSQAAVSMVMKGNEASVSADTLQRIRMAARDMGYSPNRFAQALKTRRSMTIAYVVPDITNPFYPSLLRGIQSITGASSYDLITINTDGTEVRERHFLEWLRQGRVDGVIGVFFSLSAADFKSLFDVGIGVVRIEARRKAGGSLALDDLFVDNGAAARRATAFLIESGHRDIAMIAGSGGPETIRIEGYQTALREAGLSARLSIDGLFNEQSGYRLTRSLLAEGPPPSAIFAANDLMAIGALQALREASLGVPDDVSVVGFDDIPAARLVFPSLTTVAQFESRIGKRAAEVLLQRLASNEPEAGTAEEMPFELIERESTRSLFDQKSHSGRPPRLDIDRRGVRRR